MAKYNTITDGMKIVDVANGESGYNYYGYVRKTGEYVIMRENTAQTQYRYKLGASNYTADFANRASLVYGLPTIG